MNLKDHTYCMPEILRESPYTIATYYCELDATGDAMDSAASLAVGQTIGTWTDVPGVTAEALSYHMARVLGVYETPPAETTDSLSEAKRAYIIRIAFPEVNFGDQLPMLLTAVLGNDISTALPVKLLDIEISSQLASCLIGPRFGVEGIREKCNVYDRPLILNVLKPCTGFPPEAAVERFSESAGAGSDVIKDDELLSDPSFNRLEQRIRLFHQTALQVEQETGHRALYCANITDRADRMLMHARRAAELGADMVMVNAVTAGLGVLQAVAADPAVNLPVLAHFAGFNALTEARSAGMASTLLLGKLMRLAGADAVSFPSPYSAYPLLHTHYRRMAQLMRLPFLNIRPVLPVPGGGIHPASAYRITKDLGKECMLTVGGGIQGHPGGSAAGVRALHAALHAACQGKTLDEAVRETPELDLALKKWT